MEDGPRNSDMITDCRHMICTKCCQKESNIKDGKEVLCPICRRDWTDWIYEHYPIAVVYYPCARCLTTLVNRPSSMCNDCMEELRQEQQMGRTDEEVHEVDEEEGVDDGVEDISAMLRNLGRSYRSR